MQIRISPALFIAAALWGSALFAPTLLAKDPRIVVQDGQALTDDSLKAMLDQMGYEPKPLKKGYLIAIKNGTWTLNMQIVLSENKQKIGLNANLGQVEKPEDVPAATWLALLQSNGNIDPSAFYFDKDQKKLYLHRSLDNRQVTAAFIPEQVDNFGANIRDTEALWKFTK